MKRIFIILALMLLTGCSASGEKFQNTQQAENNKGIVYIYRPSAFFAAAAWPTVFVNDEKQYSLKNKGYVLLELTPGQHTIRIGSAHFFSNWSMRDVSSLVDVKANETTFLKFTVQFEDMATFGNTVAVSGSAGLVQVPKNIAIREMRELKSSM